MILHIDMDAFYASVEQRDRPELRGKAVVVGGSSDGRGVVCAASYEAREFGVRSAMPAATAQRLCPQAVFIRPRMNVYSVVSSQVREIFGRYTPLIQPLSLDEAFLDVTGSVRLFGSPIEIGTRIKQEIRSELGLVASVGVAPNKFLAKIASDLEKPDGFCVVAADGIQEFLDPLPVRRVWGVGAIAGRKLANLGIETIGDLRRAPGDVLAARLGSWGRKLQQLSRGEDDRAVTPDHVAKSISHETTFRDDIGSPELLEAWACWQAEQVGRRLRAAERRAHTVQLKLRDHAFGTISRAQTLPEPSDRTRDILETAEHLLRTALSRQDRRQRYRLLGVGVTNLTDAEMTQGLLFDDARNKQEHNADRAVDEIASRFGSRAIRRGSSLRLPDRDRHNPYEGQ